MTLLIKYDSANSWRVFCSGIESHYEENQLTLRSNLHPSLPPTGHYNVNELNGDGLNEEEDPKAKESERLADTEDSNLFWLIIM